jgi:tRNA(Arg) A34 adenosine deaminase TadA
MTEPSSRRTSTQVTLPPWVDPFVDWTRIYRTDEEKMRLVIDLSRENMLRATGGPFAAAVFETATGRLVDVGVNSVVRLNNCTLHGEMVAFMMAQARLGSFSLGLPGMPAHEMVTSCEPCAMCMGATLWSGVRRVVWGAVREDAMALDFDEGPVFPETYEYLEARGIELARGVLREEARAVLDLYQARGGRTSSMARRAS